MLMTRVPAPPPMKGLRRELQKARAQRDSGKSNTPGGFIRETFTLEREQARLKAREWFDAWPKAAYWTTVESWRALETGEIEFTMRRLPTAD